MLSMLAFGATQPARAAPHALVAAAALATGAAAYPEYGHRRLGSPPARVMVIDHDPSPGDSNEYYEAPAIATEHVGVLQLELTGDPLGAAARYAWWVTDAAAGVSEPQPCTLPRLLALVRLGMVTNWFVRYREAPAPLPRNPHEEYAPRTTGTAALTPTTAGSASASCAAM